MVELDLAMSMMAKIMKVLKTMMELCLDIMISNLLMVVTLVSSLVIAAKGTSFTGSCDCCDSGESEILEHCELRSKFVNKLYFGQVSVPFIARESVGALI